MALRSSIDLGTNTCLLLIAECDDRSVTRAVQDFSTIVRLGQGVDQAGVLHPDAMERTLACLKEYATHVKAAGLQPGDTTAVATASARDSRNGAEFFARVERETGFKFKTLTGDEEAHATFIGGLLPGMNARDCVVIDIGGGSTELMSAQGGESLNLGSVRFTERFLKSDPVTDAEFWACQEAADEMLGTLKPWRAELSGDAQLVAVAGTATTLASWQENLARFDAQTIDRCVLSRGDVHRQVEELKWRTVAERKRLTGVEAKRADVLLAGAIILWRAMEVLNFRDARVSTRGLRYGVLSARKDL